MVSEGADDDLTRHLEALDRDIEILRSSLNPPKKKPNSVADTVIQMGLAIGRITQPLREGPKRTPEEEARANKALLLPGLLLMGLIGSGLLGGGLWHAYVRSGGLAVDLVAGLGVALVGGLMLIIFGLIMSVLARAFVDAMHRRRAAR